MWIESQDGELNNINNFLNIHIIGNVVLGYLSKPFWKDEYDCLVTIAAFETCEEAEIFFSWLKIRIKNQKSSAILYQEFLESHDYFKFKGGLDV